MGREWLLAGLSIVATLAVGLSVVRWLAPGLLGIPPDLQIVRLAREAPAFYDNVFREEDEGAEGILLLDPITGVRARPLLAATPDGLAGPTDLLGFRNRAVPDRAAVIAIGDSQTYGNNASLDENWPSQLGRELGSGRRLYAMATGGWGGVQYWDVFRKALAFRPRAVVVAFYAGNDPMESFRLAYAVDAWRELRPDPDLDVDDAPAEPPGEGWLPWDVTLAGHPVRFTPGRRLYSVQDEPTANAGWEIMVDAAGRIGRLAKQRGVAVIVTLIPTKERVFAPWLEREGVASREDFAELVAAERARSRDFARRLAGLPGLVFVDVAGPLERAVLAGTQTHPFDADGHPLPAGYTVIADTLAPAVERALAAGPTS